MGDDAPKKPNVFASRFGGRKFGKQKWRAAGAVSAAVADSDAGRRGSRMKPHLTITFLRRRRRTGIRVFPDCFGFTSHAVCQGLPRLHTAARWFQVRKGAPNATMMLFMTCSAQGASPPTPASPPSQLGGTVCKMRHFALQLMVLSALARSLSLWLLCLSTSRSTR